MFKQNQMCCCVVDTGAFFELSILVDIKVSVKLNIKKLTHHCYGGRTLVDLTV